MPVNINEAIKSSLGLFKGKPLGTPKLKEPTGTAADRINEALKTSLKKKELGSVSEPSSTESSPTPSQLPSNEEKPKQGQANTFLSNGNFLLPFNTNATNPISLLDKEQKKTFINEHGFVLAPEKQRELATKILNRPVDPTEEIISFLQNGYKTLSDNVRDETIKYARLNKNPEEKIRQQAIDAVLKFQADNKILNIPQTVKEALDKGDMGAIKKLINNVHTQQNEQLLKKYDATEGGDNEGAAILKGLGLWDAVYDKYDTDSAPLKQEKAKVDQLFTALSSKKYSYLNPAIQEDYNYYYKNQVTPNQYSALAWFKENEPEKFKQFDLEIAKADRPQTFGLKSYNKDNPDWKYLQYQLDKKGTEINVLAAGQNMQDAVVAKKELDADYNKQLADINQQLTNTTDYKQRKILQDKAAGLVQSYNTNPVNIAIQESQKALQDSQKLLDEKYPEQMKREREYMVKDILRGDGKGLFGEVLDRLKWLGRETGSGLANILGIDEFAFGGSRNYIRDLRIGDEKGAEQYQPNDVAAQQALYKLNFEERDYDALSAIKDSDLSKKEKVDKMTDYIKQNEERIRYQLNPEAGKNNWNFGSIGNQIADVGTQVGYQAALMFATDGLLKALSSAKPSTAALAATEGTELAGLEAAGANIGDDILKGYAQTYKDLGAKLNKFGTVFGTTYATTYQSAYTNGLQEGLSPEEAATYASQIAIVNGLTETISPDIDVVKKAAKGVQGVAKGITGDVLSKAAKYKDIGKQFLRGYAQNVVPETLEEIAAAYGEYGVDAIHNINQGDLNGLNNRIQQAVTTTMIGMMPLGVFSGVGTARQVPRLQKESLYRAGLYPESTTTEINALVANGNISQDEANKRIKIVNTSNQVINNMPSPAEGVAMTEQQRQNYVYNELQRGALQEKLDKATDANTSKILKKQIDDYSAANDAIVKSATLPIVEEQMVNREQITNENGSRGTSTVEQENLPKTTISEEDADAIQKAADYDLSPSQAKEFNSNIEQGLREAAQQLNSSEGEAQTARGFYGDVISDMALKYFPNEKSGAQDRSEILNAGQPAAPRKMPQDVSLYLTKEGNKVVQPILGRINNAEYINEKELDAASESLYDLLDKIDKAPETIYSAEEKQSIANLIEPLITKIEDYDYRTKTESSTVTEKVPVQVAKQTKAKQVRPALEQGVGSKVTFTDKNGNKSTGVLRLEDGNYIVSNEEGDKVAALGEKAVNDIGLKLPSSEEIDNYVTLDDSGNVQSITFQTKDGNLISIENPEKALDLAIQVSANVLEDVNPEEFETAYEEIQKEVQDEVLVKTGASIKSSQNQKTETKTTVKEENYAKLFDRIGDKTKIKGEQKATLENQFGQNLPDFAIFINKNFDKIVNQLLDNNTIERQCQ